MPARLDERKRVLILFFDNLGEKKERKVLGLSMMLKFGMHTLILYAITKSKENWVVMLLH